MVPHSKGVLANIEVTCNQLSRVEHFIHKNVLQLKFQIQRPKLETRNIGDISDAVLRSAIDIGESVFQVNMYLTNSFGQLLWWLLQ